MPEIFIFPDQPQCEHSKPAHMLVTIYVPYADSNLLSFNPSPLISIVRCQQANTNYTCHSSPMNAFFLSVT